ncbi:GNAT family N-acetyltransferase [Paenibacillus piri]|uniref:GNAT family N-acetyltransferase n=1 Tax=Paenibacillus piri TaxID=2547395 RepID=UPI001FE3DF0A|nr:GNAT family N-acetyltransferase [Paenibacillus piri]
MATIIRKATFNDIAEKQMVAKITWDQTYRGIIPQQIQDDFLQKNYSDIAMKNRIERSVLLVAVIDGMVNGFANFSPSKQNAEEAELGAIYIFPEAQSQGIGGKLMNKGIEELSGIKRLFVVVEKENIIGRRFYNSKGFVFVNEFEEQLQEQN